MLLLLIVFLALKVSVEVVDPYKEVEECFDLGLTSLLLLLVWPFWDWVRLFAVVGAVLVLVLVLVAGRWLM